MTPPDRPRRVWTRPDRHTGADRGGESAGELLWWALRAVNVHDLVGLVKFAIERNLTSTSAQR